MAKARRLKNAWALWVIALATVGITVAAELTAPVANPLGAAIRGLALTGYQLVFWAIVSSAYVPQLVRFFGRPFIKIHHLASVTGLVCITLHPILVAVDSRSAGVFLPRFDSMQVFLQLGGRPAWYLIALAVAAALLRQRLGAGWRAVHMANYVAFALATAHANLLGGNFQSPVLRVGSWVLLAAMVAAFARRRFVARRSARRKA
ncbi:MAG: hypothetical protein Kow00123_14570 [Anaerolineales bacterium]